MEHPVSILIIPVTTAAGAERANSALKLVKTVMRSTMQQDRLSCLILVFVLVHRDMKLNYENIIDNYARRHPRRVLSLNPFSFQ